MPKLHRLPSASLLSGTRVNGRYFQSEGAAQWGHIALPSRIASAGPIPASAPLHGPSTFLGCPRDVRLHDTIYEGAGMYFNRYLHEFQYSTGYMFREPTKGLLPFLLGGA